MSEHTISLVRYSDRYTHCATCAAPARWMVDGTTTCDDHIALWAERHTERQEQQTLQVGGR